MLADISNWRTTPNMAADVDDKQFGTGGFYAYGVDGIFRGAAIILFAFIAFDMMVMSQLTRSHRKIERSSTKQCDDRSQKIENFIKTITNVILSINVGLFLCLLVVTLALTTIQPYYRLVSVTFLFFTVRHLNV